MTHKQLTDRFQRVMDRFNGLCHMAYMSEWTHALWLDAMKRDVFESRDYKELTQYYKGKFSGFMESWNSRLYGRYFDTPGLLVWVLVGPDGRRFGPGDDSWLNESTEYKASMKDSTHAWRKAWERDELKPW